MEDVPDGEAQSEIFFFRRKSVSNLTFTVSVLFYCVFNIVAFYNRAKIVGLTASGLFKSDPYLLPSSLSVTTTSTTCQ